MSPDSPPWEASIGQMIPVEIGNDRIVLDEVAVRVRRLPVVEDLGGRAVAEVALPGCAGQGIQIVVDSVGDQRKCVLPPVLRPLKLTTISCGR